MTGVFDFWKSSDIWNRIVGLLNRKIRGSSVRFVSETDNLKYVKVSWMSGGNRDPTISSVRFVSEPDNRK